jgi:hypothetical protein
MYLTPRSNMINIESLIRPVEMRIEINIFVKSTANSFPRRLNPRCEFCNTQKR